MLVDGQRPKCNHRWLDTPFSQLTIITKLIYEPYYIIYIQILICKSHGNRSRPRCYDDVLRHGGMTWRHGTLLIVLITIVVVVIIRFEHDGSNSIRRHRRPVTGNHHRSLSSKTL